MKSGNSTVDTHRCGIVLVPKFGMLTLSSLIDPLRIANFCQGENLYQWEFLSADGGDIQSSDGIAVAAKKISTQESNWDSIIVCGSWNTERYDSPELMQWLQVMARKGIVIGAVETGTYILARAGLLDGYAATISWYCFKALEESYPEINLVDQIFVVDRKRITCAGGAACIDMALYNIASCHGEALAAEVADRIIYPESRQSTDEQKKIQSRKQSSIPTILRNAIDIIDHNIEEPISIPQLAKLLGLSQRKLERLFNKHFNCSAVAFYRMLRLHYARTLLTQTDMTVIDICIACGFTSTSYFSKSYSDQFGIRPRDHRTAWVDTQAAPKWPELNRLINGRPKASASMHN